MRITNEQAKEQQIRFDAFVKNTNLAKIGKAIVNLTVNEIGFYNSHNYIGRVLNKINVEQSFYHPETCGENIQAKFYSEILKYKALIAYCDSLQKA